MAANSATFGRFPAPSQPLIVSTQPCIDANDGQRVGINSARLRRALPSGSMRRPDSLRLPDWCSRGSRPRTWPAPLHAEAGRIAELGDDTLARYRSDYCAYTARYLKSRPRLQPPALETTSAENPSCSSRTPLECPESQMRRINCSPPATFRMGGRRLMRTGRPIAPLSLGVEKRATLEGLGASAQDRAGRWPKAADCPGMRQRQSQHGGVSNHVNLPQ
jgi:hypothetical protein